jgi:hypothetical protein
MRRLTDHYVLIPAAALYPSFKGSGNLRLAVQLPEGEDLNEWLAVHGVSDLCYVDHEHVMRSSSAVDFFNHLNMLYGTVTEFCTSQEVRLRFLPILLATQLHDSVSDHVCRPSVRNYRIPLSIPNRSEGMSTCGKTV